MDWKTILNAKLIECDLQEDTETQPLWEVCKLLAQELGEAQSNLIRLIERQASPPVVALGQSEIEQGLERLLNKRGRINKREIKRILNPNS